MRFLRTFSIHPTIVRGGLATYCLVDTKSAASTKPRVAVIQSRRLANSSTTRIAWSSNAPQPAPPSLVPIPPPSSIDNGHGAASEATPYLTPSTVAWYLRLMIMPRSSVKCRTPAPRYSTRLALQCSLHTHRAVFMDGLGQTRDRAL